MFKKFVSSMKHLKRRRKKEDMDESPPKAEGDAATAEEDVPQTSSRVTRKFTVNVEEAISEVADSDQNLSSGDFPEVSTSAVSQDAINKPTQQAAEKPTLPFAADSVCGGRFSNEDAYSVVPNFISFPLHALVCPPSCSGCENKKAASAAAAGTLTDAAGADNDQNQPPPSNGTPPAQGAQPLSSGTPLEELLHFFGVFDGHGGSAAAEHCAEKMHTYLLDVMSSQSSNAAALTTDTASANLGTAKSTSASESGAQAQGLVHKDEDAQKDQKQCCIHEALVTTFLKTHQEFVAGSKTSYVGSTAVAALVSDANIWVANCGDSRAVLSRGGAAVPLSYDHKPTREDEAARVQAAGGHVWWDRVMGELAVSRAIGDDFLRPYVIADPEIVHEPRTPQDEAIIMATDGLWDVFTSQEACDVALRQMRKGWNENYSNARAAARCLIREALMRSTRDNVTVIVVDLKMMKAHMEGGQSTRGGCAVQALM